MQKLGCFFLISLICTVCSLSLSVSAEEVTGSTFRQWGEETLEQIADDFGIPGSYLYSENLDGWPAFAWPQGIQFHALNAAARFDSSYINDAENLADEFHNRYWCYKNGIWGHSASADYCGDRYYDDNAWIAKALMELYNLNNKSTYLNRAKNVLAFTMSGENGPGDNPEGGIRWEEGDDSGWAVCSTAPAAVANLMIYKAAGELDYLLAGRRLYDWIKSQGFGIGIGYRGYENAVTMQAALLLYEFSGRESYLTDAQHLASAMEARYVNWSDHSLHETGQWGGHDMTAAYVDLYEVDGNQRWLDIAAGYCNFLHENCKDSNGRYPEYWDNTADDGDPALLYQASAARAYLELGSTHGGSTPRYPVKIFQDCNYDGWPAWWAGFRPGHYTADDLEHYGAEKNGISALIVNPGYKVTFYSQDNFQGDSLTKTSSDNCLYGEGWNDRASSMIIEPASGPIAHWSFNEGSGSAVSDVTGNGYDGELVNMGQSNWVSGRHCTGLSLDGVNNYVEIPDFKGITGDTARTCTGWIKTTRTSAHILGWGSAVPGTRWGIRTNDDGTLRADVSGGYIYGVTDITDGEWHHIAVVLNSPDISEALLYVDGEPETAGGFKSHSVHTSAVENVKIGVYSTADEHFQGVIDEVSIYGRALNASEIQQVYEEYALTGNLQKDEIVDLKDFSVLADLWGNTGECPEDLNCDEVVDFRDLMLLTEEWLHSN